jgi:hypothetical protein
MLTMSSTNGRCRCKILPLIGMGSIVEDTAITRMTLRTLAPRIFPIDRL